MKVILSMTKVWSQTLKTDFQVMKERTVKESWVKNTTNLKSHKQYTEPTERVRGRPYDKTFNYYEILL